MSTTREGPNEDSQGPASIFPEVFRKTQERYCDLKFKERDANRAFNMVRAAARRASGLISHVRVKGRVFLAIIFARALALDI